MLYLYRMKKAIIYCISSPLTNKCYIGATSESIADAVGNYVAEVRAGRFPDEAHWFS